MTEVVQWCEPKHERTPITVEIIFSMELRGNAVPVEGRENTFHAETCGTEPGGESVAFESEVVLMDDGFDEVGTIRYAGRGSLKFNTGHVISFGG